MGLLRWLIILLAWVFVPFVKEAFLIPKMSLWVFGMGMLCASLSVSPDVPGARFHNRWLVWVLAIILGEMFVRFYLMVILTPPNAEDAAFNWFCVLPAFYVFIALLGVVLMGTKLLGAFINQVKITKTLCSVGFFVALYTLIQYMGWGQFLYNPYIQAHAETWRTTLRPVLMIAAMGNVDYSMMFLSLLVPLYLLFSHRKYVGMMGVVLLAILLSGKRFAIVTALLSLLSYGWLRLYHRTTDSKQRWVLCAMTGIGTLLVGWFIAIHRTWWWTERIDIWAFALREWAWDTRVLGIDKVTQTMTGHGLGGFPMQFFVNWSAIKSLMPVNFQSSSWMWAHSDAVQWVYETGVLGTVPLLLLVGSSLRRGWRKSKTVFGSAYFAAFLGLLVLSGLNFPWHLAPTAMVGLVIWSMVEAEEGLT